MSDPKRILCLLLFCFLPVTGRAVITEKSVGTSQEAGLVSEYHFNEGSGAVASDLTGANPGAINAATWGQGKFGPGLLFDGVAGYVSVPDTASLHMTDAITFEAWIYINGFSSTAGKHNEICAKDWNILRLWATQENHRLQLYNVVGGVSQMVYGSTALLTDRWYHIAFTYDGKAVTLYVNGASDGSVQCMGVLSTGVREFSIGRLDGANGYFNGRIDEVRIYNRALTQNEIQAHASAAYSEVFDCNFPRRYKFEVSPSVGVKLEIRSASDTTTLQQAQWLPCQKNKPADLERFVQYRVNYGGPDSYLGALLISAQFIKTLNLTPVSPLKSDTVTFDVYFTEPMIVSETPTVSFITQAGIPFTSTRGIVGAGWRKGRWIDNEHYTVSYYGINATTGNGFGTINISGIKAATGETMPDYIDNSVFFIDCESLAPVGMEFFPNPFSPNNDGKNEETYFVNLPSLSTPEKVCVKIYNMKGALARILFDSDAGPGTISLPPWDGRDDTGRVCPIGLYIFQARIGVSVKTGTVVLSK